VNPKQFIQYNLRITLKPLSADTIQSIQLAVLENVIGESKTKKRKETSLWKNASKLNKIIHY
jgi:hypothetical protein